MSRSSRLAVLLMTMVLAPAIAHAGAIELADQGDNYAADGQLWPFVGGVIPLVGSIPFALDFGTGAVSNRTYFTDPHGRLDFTTDISGTTNTGDFVNILYNTTAGAPGQFTPRLNITSGVGLIDPSVIDKTLASHFDDKSRGLNAYRFWFSGVCPANDPSCSPLDFQAVFLRLTDNAFVLQFNYGSNFFDAGDPASQFLSGFQIGTSPASFAGARSGTGPDFCFSNGVSSAFSTIAACIGGTSSTVPEPDAASLLLLGGLLLAAGGVARRRQRTFRTAS